MITCDDVNVDKIEIWIVILIIFQLTIKWFKM